MARILDVATVAALFMMADKIGIPWEQTLSSYWNMHRELFRTAASALWVVAIWLGMLRPWDRAVRSSGAVALAGVALALCLAATPTVTEMICIHYIARLSQGIYGALMLASAAAGGLLLLALERANPDAPACVEACRRGRKGLAVAFALLCVGMAVMLVRFRQAVWYSVGLAGAFMLAWGMAALLKHGE